MGGQILEGLDLFALQGYNASFGKFSSDLYCKLTKLQNNDFKHLDI